MSEPSRWRGALGRLRTELVVAGIVAIALFLPMSAALAAKKEESPRDEQRIAAFVHKWRCPVASYLQGIHRLPQTHKDRYLVLWSKARPAFYVQCMFHDDDREIYCEAASGFYEDARRIGSFATPTRLEVLRTLGFSTDGSKGNWAQERAFTSADEIATLMLESLGHVFAASTDDVMLYRAPLLSKRRSNRVAAGAECAPVS